MRGGSGWLELLLPAVGGRPGGSLDVFNGAHSADVMRSDMIPDTSGSPFVDLLPELRHLV